jgi:hypothetical protein
MKLPHRRSTVAALLAGASGAFAVAAPQLNTPARPPDPPDETRLPNGKLQRDEMLKADYDKCLKNAAELVDLSQQLQQDIEKNGAFVFSLATLKKTDEIEKLAKKIRSRLRHE